jgi:hypothetical protein
MAEALIAPMPPDLDLSQGCTIRLDAIDPTTGNSVGNVLVTGGSIWAASLAADTGTVLDFGPFMLVPGPGA